MIQAVLFDLDGTLTNTIDDIATAMNRALRLHGLPGWETKEYCYLVGNGAKILAQRAVRDRQDLADAVQAEYQAYYEKHTQVKNAALRRHSGAAARLGGARLEAGGALQ